MPIPFVYLITYMLSPAPGVFLLDVHAFVSEGQVITVFLIMLNYSSSEKIKDQSNTGGGNFVKSASRTNIATVGLIK